MDKLWLQEYSVEHMCGLEHAVNHMWQMMFKCSFT